MKKNDLILIMLLYLYSLTIIKSQPSPTPSSTPSSQFCLNPREMETPFPEVNTKDTFYFKKLFNNNFIIGTENSGAFFRLSISDDNNFVFEQLDSVNNNYYVYADAFGNINPLLVTDNIENPTKIKYILTEGITSENEYIHALYDVENNELKEGKFSDAFPDFKILEAIDENEYIGAIKLNEVINSVNTIYSIKLQIMSFSQISKGKIKLLNAKEYSRVENKQYNVNNIFYIKSLKKLMIIRTYEENIFIDFIDYYESSFGTVITNDELKAEFDVSDFKFNSIELKTENDKTYIISCFRKYNYVYCFSGYYDIKENKYHFINDEPKLTLMMASCDNRKRPDINLSKLNVNLGIVGCPGEPYHAIRFDINLNKIGTEIIFPSSYSEFVVINDYSLFVFYRGQKPDNNYYLYGCIYYLPVCENKKVFLELKNEDHNLNDAFGIEDNLKNMENIYIISYSPYNSDASILDNTDDTNPIAITNGGTYNRNILLYRYYNTNPESFEDMILYKTVVNPDNIDAKAFSEECTLKIINCYKSCSECNDIGNDESHNCVQCKSNHYFLDDPSSKLCYDENEVIDNYYLDAISDPENKVFKRCYEGCKECYGAPTSTSHNCISCFTDKHYYPFTQTVDDSGNTTYNCYLDVLPPEKYFFNKSRDIYNNTDDIINYPYFIPCEGHCLRCNGDIPSGENNCKICDTQNGYYALFDNDDSKNYAKCLHSAPDDNYFLDRPAGRFRKCYPSCNTCDESGDDEYNNCLTCKNGLSQYIVDSKTCKCEYNFYYKLDSDNNFLSFECTEDIDCPNEYQYLIINSQNIRQCVKECPKDYPYIYNSQCFNHKLNGTFYEENNNHGSDDSNIDNTQCIINDYITSSIPKDDITKVTKDYVINYQNEYNSDYTFNHANLIRNDNEDYLLLIFENDKCLKKITDEYGLNFIDLTEYAPIIKTKNGIEQNEPLTYVFLYSDPDDINDDNQKIDYECYNSKTGDKLDLDAALKDQKITEHIPAPTGNNLKKLQYLSKYAGQGIDFSDPNSDFFNSKCFPFTSDKGKDVPLPDRRKYFFNNIKICENNCIFKGIDETTNTAKCECPYQKGSTAVIQKEIKFPDYNEEYFIYDMWKCLSKKMVEGKELKKSYITIIVFCLLILTILFTVLYFVFLKNKFQFIKKVSNSNYNKDYNTLSQSNKNSNVSLPKRSITSKQKKSIKKLISNPPKNENEKDEDNDLIKEKGYVHDVKRPFNYDNNNLFFHADEHYTIGNQNLNSLFMGQNFKNDYSKEIEQFQNDEKKPKEIINNYNNINIPETRLYKKNKTAFPKVNNRTNINRGSVIFKLDDESPYQKNKNKKNSVMFFKNDISDGNSTDPFRNDDNKKKIEIPVNKNRKTSESNNINVIPEISCEENIEEDIKNATGEIGEENMKINQYEFDYAKKYDLRNFCSFYFNQIKHRQIFFYTGYFHTLAEGIFMKIIMIIFHILICLFFNLFWYRSSYVHDEFISTIDGHAKFSSKYSWFRILLSLVCYIIVICLLHLIYLPQLKIYYTLIDENIGIKQKMEIIKNKLKCMKINYIIFVVINFCFLIGLILYVLIFSYVFVNSKTDLMISFIITFLLAQVLPFIFVFFVTCFRFIGLKCDSPCAYKFSLFFTI